jgi:predicted RNA-binding Zn ribbon-like protein
MITAMNPSSDPASDLEPLRAFINTVDLKPPVDPLEGPDDLDRWCHEHECAGLGPDEMRRLRAFREALRGVLEANSGSRDAAAAWSALEPFVRGAGYGMRIDALGSPALEPAGLGAERTIAAMLAIVYDALRRGTWTRLKACRKDTCRWAYYDRSKNGSGAWCSMAVCGNRMKAQRRRKRAKKPA